MRLGLRVTSGIAFALFMSLFFAMGSAIILTASTGSTPQAEESQAVRSSDIHEGQKESLCAWRTHDPCAPHIEVTLPNGGEVFRGVELIDWTAIDFEGEQLVYDVYYSSDGGVTWMVIVAGLTTPGYRWDTTQVSDGEGYLVRVDVLGSGVASGRDQSNNVFSIDNLPGGSPMQDTIEPFTLAVVSVIIGVMAIAGIVLLVRRGGQ
ncbi:MAG: hypothetical protein ACFFB7_03400 [Candidatus Sifarchaeia archaeon]